MSEIKHVRKHLFVDPKVQGALALRVVLYWVVYMIGVSMMLICWQLMTGPPRSFYMHLDTLWFQFGAALVASILLLPLVVIDIIRMSNRFVGPLLRLRRSMRQLARGEPVKPIKFRENDFWRELADEFNAILARIKIYSNLPRKDIKELTAESEEKEIEKEEEAVAIQ